MSRRRCRKAGATLTNTDFSNADLRFANVSGADLSGASMAGCKSFGVRPPVGRADDLAGREAARVPEPAPRCRTPGLKVLVDKTITGYYGNRRDDQNFT